MALRGICMASNRSRESWMVFARVFTWLCDVVLQVHHLNTQNLRFPIVLWKKIDVMLMQFLHVFSRVLWRFEPFLGSSGFSIRCGFWFLYVFRMFFAVFGRAQFDIFLGERKFVRGGREISTPIEESQGLCLWGLCLSQGKLDAQAYTFKKGRKMTNVSRKMRPLYFS